MTIRHMKIFIAVYNALSITKAAQTLHMTQPAVSRAIQEMEQFYGICLFERMNRKIYVTESAKELYSYAVHIVDTFDSMEQEMKNWDELGVLRIGSTITLGNFFLPGAIADFQKQFPRLRIRVTISNGAKLKQDLLENRIDLALIEGTSSCEFLREKPFRKDRLILITPPGHPLLSSPAVTLQDTLQYPLLFREPGSAVRALLDHTFALHGLSPEPIWESASTQAIVKAVQAGLGIAFLPQQLAAQDLSLGSIATRDLADERFERTCYIVWHTRKYLTHAGKAFISYCSSHGSL